MFRQTTTSVIKGAGTFPSGYKIGQNGADGHSGANSVPTAQHRLACMMIRGIRYTGGQNQLLSSPQSQVKASTASVPGFQNLELKRGSWLL